MKLKYEKPLIAVEHYALSQAIATCTVKVGLNDDQCLAKDSDVPTELQDLAAEGFFGQDRCSFPSLGDEDDFNGVCYHTSAGSVLFVS